jgi:hypothetical protein
MPEIAQVPDTDLFPGGSTDELRTQDDFDLNALRLSQDFASEVGGKKLLTRVPVGRPDKHWFFRIHPDEGYRATVGVIELKAEREVYVVHTTLVPELIGELRVCTLHTGVSRQGVPFLWAIPLPDPDGRHNPWHDSALQAAELAMTKWIRLTADMNCGAYVIYEAAANLPEPDWPELTFQELVQIGFRDKIISDPSHPVLRRLRGEV